MYSVAGLQVVYIGFVCWCAHFSDCVVRPARPSPPHPPISAVFLLCLFCHMLCLCLTAQGTKGKKRLGKGVVYDITDDAAMQQSVDSTLLPNTQGLPSWRMEMKLEQGALLCLVCTQFSKFCI